MCCLKSARDVGSVMGAALALGGEEASDGSGGGEPVGVGCSAAELSAELTENSSSEDDML